MAGSTTFIPTERDYVAASRAIQLDSLMSFRGALLRMGLIVPVAAIGWGIASGEWAYSVSVILAWLIVVAAVQAVNYLLVPQSVRRMISRRPSLTSEIRFDWSDRGLEAASKLGTSRPDWGEVRLSLHGRYGFVFLVGRKGMLIVPARALDPAKTADLLATARKSR